MSKISVSVNMTYLVVNLSRSEFVIRRAEINLELVSLGNLDDL
jgi:hypothetical protein